jgi:hypothetical protein
MIGGMMPPVGTAVKGEPKIGTGKP